jgi:toxin ParE1/3/4
MAGARVEFSVEARTDVARLTLWIGRESGAERAQAIVDRLDAAIARLARRPRIGRVAAAWKGEPRVFGVRPWLIVYQPLSGGDGVLVIRILDNRRDIAALLGEKT